MPRKPKHKIIIECPKDGQTVSIQLGGKIRCSCGWEPQIVWDGKSHRYLGVK
jgi:hypothetical protein